MEFSPKYVNKWIFNILKDLDFSNLSQIKFEQHVYTVF